MKVILQLDYETRAKFLDMAAKAQCTVDALASTIVAAFFKGEPTITLPSARVAPMVAGMSFEPNGTEARILELLAAKPLDSTTLRLLSGRSHASVTKALTRLMHFNRIKRTLDPSYVSPRAGRPPYVYSLVVES